MTEEIIRKIIEKWIEAKSERVQCLVEQLTWHMRNYGNLEKREAQLGEGNVPVEIMNRKDMIRAQINRILREIQREDGLIKDVESVIIDVISSREVTMPNLHSFESIALPNSKAA